MSSQANLGVPDAPLGVSPAPPFMAELGGRRGWRTLVERREAAIFVVALLLFLFFAIDNGNFVSYDNFVNLTQFLAPIAVIGGGEVLLLTCGEVDLSLGTVFIFFPFMTYFLWVNFGIPLGIAIALSVVGAAMFGFVNGFVTTFFNVPSFVTTLGTLFALWGVTLLSSGGVQETMTANGLGGDILGNYSWSEIFWALGMILLVYVVLHRTRFGMHIVATGGNLLGAAESGIPVKRVKIYCFMFASAMAAIIGIIDSVRITTLDPGNDGTQEMFYAISAAVIGGTALTGGRGTAIGVALGAIVLGVLNVGFNIVGLSAYTFQLILGIAIVASMIVNSQFQRAAMSRLGRRRLNL